MKFAIAGLLVVLSGAAGKCQELPITRSDSAKLIEALATHASSRTDRQGTWWVSRVDSAGLATIAQALRSELRVIPDTITPRCNSAEPTGHIGNRVGARISLLRVDSAEVRLTLRCLDGSMPDRRVGSVITYSLVRRTDQWRVVLVRAAVS